MKDGKASSKDIIMSILPLQPLMRKCLLNEGKVYATLLQALLKQKFDDEYEWLPTFKELYTSLSISPGVLRRWLEKLDEDLYDLLNDRDEAHLILGPHDCWFSASWHDHFFHFRAKVAMVPHIGMNLTIPFARAKMNGMDWFYVHSVSMNLTGFYQSYEIVLKVGHFNCHSLFEEHKLQHENYGEWLKKYTNLGND